MSMDNAHMEGPEREIVAAVDRFIGNDTGRSVAVQIIAPWDFRISRNGDVPRPAASVIKIAMVMAVYKRASGREADLSRRFDVSRLQKTRYASFIAGFDAGHELSLGEICRFALITSDNPLAVFLQSLVSFEEVTRLLHDCGCEPVCKMQAGFAENDLGPGNRANVLTASSGLRLLSELETNPVYRDLVRALENNLRNNRIPARLPESATIAHKTGSLQGVANDIGSVRDDPVRFRVAFLTDNQDDVDITSMDIAICSERIYTAVASYPLSTTQTSGRR